MEKVVSFCIFGNDRKYTEGLLENLKIIKKELPEFVTWIYVGSDVGTEHIEEYKKYNIKLIYPEEQGMKLTVYRIFPIDNENVEIVFVRNVDSRINDRDLWCMNQFIKSDKLFHIIRDNILHKQRRICGGLFGIKKRAINIKLEEEYNNDGIYDSDGFFLEQFIYPLIKNNILIHSDIIAFNDENYPIYIDVKNNGYNFVGNVYQISKNEWNFNFWKQLNENIINHLNWLVAQKVWRMIINIYLKLNINNFDEHTKYNIFNIIYMAYYYTDNIEGCRKMMEMFKYCHVDEHIINNSNFIFLKLKEQGYTIIGTTDVYRIPKDKEIIIIYGNYHHSVNNLPVTNIIKRHAIYYNQVKHDIFESDECWDYLGKIYIINLVERMDRRMEIVTELARMNAPLDRIHFYKAHKESITGDKNIDPHIGTCKSHIGAVELFLKTNDEYCIIFEDDVTFTSNINEHQNDLKEFFNRKYQFDVLLLLSSKYYKIEPFDNLISYSRQACTTCSCYILSRDGALKVLPLFKEGYDQMTIGGNTNIYAVDRYWAKIQSDNKFFVMNNKFGYQRCGFSSITGNIGCHFD